MRILPRAAVRGINLEIQRGMIADILTRTNSVESSVGFPITETWGRKPRAVGVSNVRVRACVRVRGRVQERA